MLFRFVVYGVLGWCAEIVWTAVRGRLSGRQRDWKLAGTTYLWMFPLYGLLAPLYEPIHNALRSRPWWQRGLSYMLSIWAVEYSAGSVLRRLIGVCPWDYTAFTRWHIRGLIRLDYGPVWAAAALALEPFHDFLVRLTPAVKASLRRNSRRHFDDRLEHDPLFLERIERARHSLRSGWGVKLEDLGT